MHIGDGPLAASPLYKRPAAGGTDREFINIRQACMGRETLHYRNERPPAIRILHGLGHGAAAAGHWEAQAAQVVPQEEQVE